MLVVLFAFALSDRFALLFAGSNGYDNYRHQADISTLYTLLLHRGFQKDHIIQFQYDDIVKNSENPFPGQIFHNLDHVNFYPGSDSINYRGENVTAAQFYQAIKSLPTTKEDYVFIYYDNHGAEGILGVPDGNGDYIYADDLAKALSDAEAAGKWRHALFGIEACEAGSTGEVFNAKNLLTITASGTDESSYAAIWDSALDTYLTNEFTNYWIGFLNRTNLGFVNDLYNYVLNNTQESHVNKYGNSDILKIELHSFFGHLHSEPQSENYVHIRDGLSQKQASLKTLDSLVQKTHNSKALLLRQKRKHDRKRFELVLSEIVKHADIKNYEFHMKNVQGKLTPEYFSAVRYFTSKYGIVNGDDLSRFSVLKNLCNSVTLKTVKDAIDQVL